MLSIAAAEQNDVGTVLLTRLAGFTAFLHENGYGVSAADTVDAVDTAAQMGIIDQSVLRWNLQALLCNRFEEWQRFDALFDAYFLPPNKTMFVRRDVTAGTQDVSTAGNDDRAEESQAAEEQASFDDTNATGGGASREESL